jgi:hypothetical protein
MSESDVAVVKKANVMVSVEFIAPTPATVPEVIVNVPVLPDGLTQVP